VPTLVVKDGPNAGRRFPIESQATLGRERTDILIDDPEVSRQHALIRWAQGRLELSDLQSANGTFVNGTRLEPRGELRDGDVVKIGMTSIVVEIPPPRDPNATVISPR
jgi:pSer/pThr/pTyr-binding forkhead associated (FHA) protein